MEQRVSLVTLEVDNLPRAGCGHMVIEERSLAAIGNGAQRAGALQILRDITAGLGPDVMVEQLRGIQHDQINKAPCVNAVCPPP